MIKDEEETYLKRPEASITKGYWYYDHHTGRVKYDKGTVCVITSKDKEGIDNNHHDGKAISAVPDMIDALIDCRKELNELHEYFDLNDYVYEVFTKIIQKTSQALKKAGCTDE